MTTTYWIDAGADGDASNGANWSGGSGAGGIPGAGQDVVIGMGGRDITIGMTAVSFASFTVTSGFAYNIVTSGGAAVTLFTAVTGTLTYAGKGARAVFGPTGTVANAKFQHSGGQQVSLTAGTYTNIANSTGALDIAAACVLSGAAGNAVRNMGGVMTIGYNATAIQGTIYNSAGTTVVKRVLTGTANIPLAVVTGGTVVHQDNGITNLTQATTGAIIVGAGGTYNKQSSGTDTSVAEVAAGGRYTLEGNVAVATGTVNVGTVNVQSNAIVSLNIVPGITVAGTINYFGKSGGPPTF